MKRIKLLPLLSLIMVFAASCSNYGTRVKINDKIEVYYKGDGVNEADATKVGKCIDTTFKSATNNKTLQVTKDSGQYVVRMVVDKEKVKDNALDVSFMAMQFLIESQVFTGSKVKLVLTDEYFKDIKTYPSVSSAK